MALPPPSQSSTALVTGPSSGIGAEIARELGRRGHGLTLVARREERLRDLAAEIAGEHGVRVEVIGADLAMPTERDRLATAIAELGLDVEVLVNNAGFGDSGPLHKADRERVVEMVTLNCGALLDLQARYSPAMAERGRGVIINVASTASFQPIPGTATYAATKAFVLSLTEGTHAELKRKGVTVTALCPGPVKTEFAEVAGVGGAEESLPGVFWTDADFVAKTAVEGADSGKRVVVPGAVNRATAVAGQHSPRMALLPLAQRMWRSGTK